MFEPIRRDLAWIPRWSIIRVNRRQSVAEHSYYVACYGMEIANTLNWPSSEPDFKYDDFYKLRNDLALYLLRHDEDEAITGDIPGPIKRKAGFDCRNLELILEKRFGKPTDYNSEMKAIKKAADLVDECMYLAGEMASGNNTVETSYNNSFSRLEQAVDELPGNADNKKKLWRTIRDAIGQELQYQKDYTGFANM